MWVMTDLEAKAGQGIYFARPKIKESFCDLKSLLSMTKLMNKKEISMEKCWFPAPGFCGWSDAGRRYPRSPLW